MMCCVVHVGEGVEWGPRTAHTGVLASLVEDSLDWLGSRFTLGNTTLVAIPHSHLVLNTIRSESGEEQRVYCHNFP